MPPLPKKSLKTHPEPLRAAATTTKKVTRPAATRRLFLVASHALLRRCLVSSLSHRCF
jgi:hypothetical protein